MCTGWNFPDNRSLDVICFGRANVDLYAQQENCALEHVQSFRKSVGGSPANIATAVVRLGGKAGLISMISDDGFGRYIRQFMRDNGVDEQGLKTCATGMQNSVAFTELRPQNCQVLIFRKEAADLQIRPEDIDPAYIASARALLITGAALSASPSREACLHAMDLARQAGTTVIIDLDYRPYGWKNQTEAAVYLRMACFGADIVIGNREEFTIIEYFYPQATRDDASSANLLLRGQAQVVVVKDGERGCRIFMRDGTTLAQGIFPVTARKPYGSGDAFAGTLIWALCRGHNWQEAARLGAAAAAINVSRDGCAEVMATRAELNAFIRQNPT